MTDVIQLLPDAIANQIAAGEVIQRPASVVKELMENAIDAGSNNIRLIVKEAGRSLIQVVDNGCGMSETDARMSFERHATSKIREAKDLFSIRTMGFRGEAMASMAAVAHVEMRTRRQLDDLGTRLVVEGSELKVQEACQCNAGTSIAVKNLFYNVPARRNFLKSNPVEMRHIIDEFLHLALSYPDLFFSLHHNNEELYHLPPGNLRQRLIAVFGKDYNKKIVPVTEETDAMRLEGFVGKPEFAKKGRGEQFFFVNQRYIRSNYLHHAVMTAYEELLPKETVPFYALFIDIDPNRIDINVHPTKQEIKFDDERLVYNYLRVAVRHALGRHSIMPSLDFDQEQGFSMRIGSASEENSPTLDEMTSQKPNPASGRDTYSGKGPASPPRKEVLRQWEDFYKGLNQEEEETPGQEAEAGSAEADQTMTIGSAWADDAGEDKLALGAAKPQREPYQIHASYIVSHIKSGFLLIDQQAAHERILFEQYLQVLEQQSAVTQTQLFPRTLTLTPADATVLNAILDQVNLLGFDIQAFGGNTFVINGVPAELAGKKDEVALIETLMEQYRMNIDLKLDAAESIARAMARSAAIRRGQPLTVHEMQSLIDRLFACATPYKNPSGRFCFVTYELDDLAKRFEGA